MKSLLSRLAFVVLLTAGLFADGTAPKWWDSPSGLSRDGAEAPSHPWGVRLLAAQEAAPAFAWPTGKRAAISLSFDDGRDSQVLVGTAVLKRHQALATFFVVPSAVERQLAGWKQAVAEGHEIGNHSLNHPCSGNFPWSRSKATENYTLAQMREELVEANRRIHALLGVTARTFAYPCGQTFVGRGVKTASYVPLVAELFLAGREWRDESPNDPSFADLAKLTGVEMDGRDFSDLRPTIEEARKNGAWLVLAGHEIGEPGRQTTRATMLEELLRFANDPKEGLWLATVSEVAEYVKARQGVN
jgi:peptidoglycan/xylan/chitin deacetylase (PgdA/CDA1 family)